MPAPPARSLNKKEEVSPWQPLREMCQMSRNGRFPLDVHEYSIRSSFTLSPPSKSNNPDINLSMKQACSRPKHARTTEGDNWACYSGWEEHRSQTVHQANSLTESLHSLNCREAGPWMHFWFCWLDTGILLPSYCQCQYHSLLLVFIVFNFMQHGTYAVGQRVKTRW